MRIEYQSGQSDGFLATIAVPIQQDKNILDFFLHSAVDSIPPHIELSLIVDGKQPAVMRVIEEHIQAFAAQNVALTVAGTDTPGGWERCINWSMRNRRGAHFATVDSDVILTGDWAEALFSHFSTGSRIGAVGGLLLYPQTGGIQHCGIAFSEDGAKHVYLNAKPNSLPDAPYAVQSVIGAMCALSEGAIQAAGEFDEGFFNAYSDFDYCMKIRTAGFQVVVDPRAIGYHWERSNGIHRNFSRRSNLARFWRRWGNALQPDLWDFVGQSIKKHLATQSSPMPAYQALDLAASRADARMCWERIPTMGLQVSSVQDHSADIPDDGDIWLPRILGSDGHRSNQPFLILVDNFVRLLGNKYWSELRAPYGMNDMVLDLYGNIIEFQTLQEQAWPGNKVR
jgi:hypothetical protein